jgi:hypothetical protein
MNRDIMQQLSICMSSFGLEGVTATFEAVIVMTVMVRSRCRQAPTRFWTCIGKSRQCLPAEARAKHFDSSA